MLAIFLYCAFLVAAILGQETPPPSPIVLDFSCHLDYVLASRPCTCLKVSAELEGQVQWVFPNGTEASQLYDSQSGAAVLIAEPSHKYALNQSYICQIVHPDGTIGAALNYTAHFMFGPESATLKWKDEPKEPIYLCPSNETKQLHMQCEVPAHGLNPSPVFTAFIDQYRYGSYDRLPGSFIKEDQVWRLDITFKLRGPGAHTVSCHVRNMYYAANWFSLRQNITVSGEQPPSSFQC